MKKRIIKFLEQNAGSASLKAIKKYIMPTILEKLEKTVETESGKSKFKQIIEKLESKKRIIVDEDKIVHILANTIELEGEVGIEKVLDKKIVETQIEKSKHKSRKRKIEKTSSQPPSTIKVSSYPIFYKLIYKY